MFSMLLIGKVIYDKQTETVSGSYGVKYQSFSVLNLFIETFQCSFLFFSNFMLPSLTFCMVLSLVFLVDAGGEMVGHGVGTESGV